MEDVHNWGGTEPEVALNLYDRESIIAIEACLAAMAADNKDTIDWYRYPESGGRIAGNIPDSSTGQDIGHRVIFSRDHVARVISYKALQSESRAKAARLMVATFAGGIAMDSIKWFMSNDDIQDDISQDEPSDTGVGMAVLNTTGHNIFLMTRVEKVNGVAEPSLSLSQWLLYTEAEIEAFYIGRANGEFDIEQLLRPSLPYAEELSSSSDSPQSLIFSEQLTEVNGIIRCSGNDELISRWATRSRSNLTYNSKYVNFISDSFRRSQVELAE